MAYEQGDAEKHLQALEEELLESSNTSEMEVESNDQQSNKGLSEAVEKLQIKDPKERLSGAGRKRFKWLLKQGLDPKEARAKAMLPLPARTGPGTPMKRTRSEDSTPEHRGEKLTEPKRSKTIASSSNEEVEATSETSDATSSFANALKSVKVGILSEGYPDENLSDVQMNLIQERILELISEKEGAPYPQFSGIAHRPGWLSLNCDNAETAEWLKSIAGQLTPWEGAKLKVVDEADLPRSKILSAYFPNSAEDDSEKILKLVKAQNQHLTPNGWKIIRRNNEGKAAHLIMSVDLASIARLKSNGYKVSYKFGKVTLHNKSEPKQPQKPTQKPEKAAQKPTGPNTDKVTQKPSVSQASEASSSRGRQEGRDRVSETPLKGLRPGKGKRDWKPRKPNK